MYNFVFWFLYKYYERKGSKSRRGPAWLVVTVIWIHLMVIIEAVEKITGVDPLKYFRLTTFLDNKINLCLVIITSMMLSYNVYYKKKADRIFEKYEKVNPFSVRNILLFFIIVFVPLFFALILDIK